MCCLNDRTRAPRLRKKSGGSSAKDSLKGVKGETMKHTLWIALAVLCSANHVAGGDDTKFIQGAWDVVSVADNGASMPAEKLEGARIILTKDELIGVLKGEKKVIGTYTLKPNEKPKQIDLTTEGKHVMKGI